MRMWVLLVLAFALSSDASPKPPKLVTSEFLVTERGGFLLHPALDVSYYLELTILEKLSLPAWLQVEFQSPVESADMDLKYLKVEPGQKTLRLESRVFQRANLRKSYRVIIDVFSDEKMRNKIGEHIQEIEFAR